MGLRKTPAMCTNLAEGKVGQEGTDQKEVDVKEDPDAFRHFGMEGDQAQGQLLHAHDVHLQNVPHQNARDGDPADQEKRKVIRGKRDVPHLGDEDPSEKQKGDRSQQHEPADQHTRRHESVDRRNAGLHEAVQMFDHLDEEGDRLSEKPEVPQHDHQKRIMEGKGCQPQPLLPLIPDLRAVS